MITEIPQPTILVGCSVNAELHYTFKRLGGEKGQLKDDPTVEIGGSSANVVRCLYNLGMNPMLFAPTASGKQDTPSKILYNNALEQLPMRCISLPIFDKVPMAVCPEEDDSDASGPLVYGYKGKLLDRPRVLGPDVWEGETFQDPIIRHGQDVIKQVEGKWRIATGVNGDMCQLGAAILSRERGFRALGIHHTFCHEDYHLPVADLQKIDDLFILNKIEFDWLGMTFAEIHRRGVSVIAVTNGEHGGTYSVCNESTRGIEVCGSYDAYPLPNSMKLHLLGAGDWFFGAMMFYIIVYCEKYGKSLLTISAREIGKAATFGAIVAARKIQMKGVSNGPKIKEIKEEIPILFLDRNKKAS